MWSKVNHRCAHRWDYTAAAVPSALTADMEADQERRAIDKREKEKARRKEQDRRKKEAEKKRNEMEESAAAAKQVGSSSLLRRCAGHLSLERFRGVVSEASSCYDFDCLCGRLRLE